MEEEKKLTLHLAEPLIYTKCGEPHMANIVTYCYLNKVELIKSDGRIFCPVMRSAYTNVLVPVKETEEEIRAMVDGELVIVEYKDKKKKDDTEH